MRNFFFYYLTRKINDLEQSRHYGQKETKSYCRIHQYQLKNIKISSSVELLGVHIDDKLNLIYIFKNLQIHSKPISCSNKASDVPELRRKENAN